MKNTIRLTERDLTNLVKRVINEGKYDLETMDFSDIEKPQFGGGTRAYFMRFRKSVRDIKRKLDSIVESDSLTSNQYDVIMKIEEMLENI